MSMLKIPIDVTGQTKPHRTHSDIFEWSGKSRGIPIALNLFDKIPVGIALLKPQQNRSAQHQGRLYVSVAICNYFAGFRIGRHYPRRLSDR